MADHVVTHGEASEEKASTAADASETTDADHHGDGSEERPAKLELAGWHFYAFCSYFVHTVLIPILFSLTIAQVMAPPFSSSPENSRVYNSRGISCSEQEIFLYQSMVNRTITAGGSNFSPLHWTAISWGVGALLAVGALVPSAWHLDRGQSPPLVLAASTAAGAFFCLLTGFSRVRWVFPVFIAAIAAADTVAAAAHSHHLAVTSRGRHHFRRRGAVTGRLSLHATAAGSVGAAVIAAFTYHMMRRSDHRTSLWVVSIFSGLQWFAGILHAFTMGTPVAVPPRSPSEHGKFQQVTHVLSIFRYPHAAGSLVPVLLSSFSSMCVFSGAVLYVFGQLCMKPVSLLYLWLLYFLSPAVSLLALHPLQLLLRADAVKMQLLGFLMSAVAAGAGFYYRGEEWRRGHVLLAALLQSAAAGALHAFGRALASDCSPAGREGAVAVWASWARTAGACAGFAVASAHPGEVGRTLGASFWAVAAGICVLIFGNISHAGGLRAAGLGKEERAGHQSSDLHEMEQGRKSVHLDSSHNLAVVAMEENGGGVQV
uniref:Interleukin-15 n=1 Tax=Anthurium amnicola TaxID=1678845 RepID=A0A1D1Y416_9ARAE